jgi:hypothetical protein
MDDKTHQIYSYMLHRASGICSAVKQMQFQALTELTVNRLMGLSQAQLKALNENLKNQRRLSEMEIENMKKFKENDGIIKESQQQSLDKLKSASNLIEENIHQLEIETEVRAKSQEKLSEIEKLSEEISLKLFQHSSEQMKMLREAEEISSILEKNKIEILQQFNENLAFLNHFNSVLQVLSGKAENFQNYIDSFFDILRETGIEFTQEFIVLMALNLVYFMCGMILLMFFNAEQRARNVLVGLVGMNAVLAFFKVDFPFIGINILVWLCFLGKILNICMKIRNLIPLKHTKGKT